MYVVESGDDFSAYARTTLPLRAGNKISVRSNLYTCASTGVPRTCINDI